ncbi:MGMT family protein [uncultured Campylobacter sp.]|nr:MGMT family protein [uncultured Campylobacter sp.]
MWEILLKIPYGQTTTYGQIAREIAAARGLARCPRKPWAAP